MIRKIKNRSRKINVNTENQNKLRRNSSACSGYCAAYAHFFKATRAAVDMNSLYPTAMTGYDTSHLRAPVFFLYAIMFNKGKEMSRIRIQTDTENCGCKV